MSTLGVPSAPSAVLREKSVRRSAQDDVFAASWRRNKPAHPDYAIDLWKEWRRGSESNRRIKVLQTSPLPLGYRASVEYVSFPDEKSPSAGGGSMQFLERETGVE